MTSLRLYILFFVAHASICAMSLVQSAELNNSQAEVDSNFCSVCNKQGCVISQACYKKCGRTKLFYDECLFERLFCSKIGGLDPAMINKLSCADCQKNNPILPTKQQ